MMSSLTQNSVKNEKQTIFSTGHTTQKLFVLHENALVSLVFTVGRNLQMGKQIKTRLYGR